MDSINLTALFIIFCVAIGTYSLRVSGLLLSNKFMKEGKIKIFLEYLPSTLLLSLIVPAILKEGYIGLIGTLFIIVCMYKTKSILFSMIIGISIVALGRNFF